MARYYRMEKQPMVMLGERQPLPIRLVIIFQWGLTLMFLWQSITSVPAFVFFFSVLFTGSGDGTFFTYVIPIVSIIFGISLLFAWLNYKLAVKLKARERYATGAVYYSLLTFYFLWSAASGKISTVTPIIQLMLGFFSPQVATILAILLVVAIFILLYYRYMAQGSTDSTPHLS